MVSVDRLLADLEAAGCRFAVVDGRLRADAPAGTIDQALDAAIREHRDALIARMLDRERRRHALDIASRRRGLLDDDGTPRCLDCRRPAVRDGRHVCPSCAREEVS